MPITEVTKINPLDEIGRNHICYYTQDAGPNDFRLFAVEEVIYRHPKSKVDTIPRLETRLIRTVNRDNQKQAAELLILESAQLVVWNNNQQR